jgi:uncharacterized protein involved in exopolysaccharide biosynthesis
LGILLGFIFSLIQTPNYEATAIIAITELRQDVVFDNRITSREDAQPLRGLPELAISDTILLNLLEVLDIPFAQDMTVTHLRAYLRAKPGDDLHLLRLTATTSNPKDSAILANTWAENFVEWINLTYGQGGEDKVVFFETQLSQSKQNLETVEQSLILYQAQNDYFVISNTLSIYTQLHQNQLNTKVTLGEIELDIQRLKQQVGETANDISFATQITALLLQLQIYQVELPLQFHLGIDGNQLLIGNSQEEQIAFITNLLTTIQEKMIEVDSQLADLAPQIMNLQKQKQESEAELRQLQLSHEVALQTYTALAYKVEEERLATQDINDGAILVSQADTPTRPVSLRKPIFIVAGGFLGFSGALFMIFLMAYLRSEKQN